MKVDNNLANYLAQETNPDAVREVLKSMEMDPNIQLPDEVRKRLEEEGISAVRKKYNQYGAEYDPNDSSINFKDQSFATDALKREALKYKSAEEFVKAKTNQ